MFKKELVLLITLLLIPNIFALTSLQSPENGFIFSVDSITFICSSDLLNLTSMTLYHNSSDWQAVSTITANTNTNVSFPISNLSNGQYLWTCLAQNSSNQEWGENRTFNVQVTLNNPPQFIPIPNITIDEDNSYQINLSEYFTDNETLSYSVSVASNIQVIITNELANITPIINWNGLELVSFTANDGSLTNSTSVNIIVNATPDNVTLLQNVSDISLSTNITLNLSEYFKDFDGESLIYSYSESPNLSITFSNNIATLIPNSTFTGETKLILYASDSQSNISSNTVTITVSSINHAPIINDNSPSISVTMDIGERVVFSITATDEDGDNLTYTWSLDGFSYSSNASFVLIAEANDVGVHTFNITVSDGFLTDSFEWLITVTNQTSTANQNSGDDSRSTNSSLSSPTVQADTETSSETVTETTAENVSGDVQAVSAVCGNGIVEAGENCETCEEDFICAGGEECVNAQCVPKEGPPIIFISITSFVIVIVFIFVYLYLKKKRTEEFVYKELNTKDEINDSKTKKEYDESYRLDTKEKTLYGKKPSLNPEGQDVNKK